MRITTNAYVLVGGQRKRMEFTAPDGVMRPVQVDIDLDECPKCGALLSPGGFNARHEAFHLVLEAVPANVAR